MFYFEPIPKTGYPLFENTVQQL